MEAYLDNAATTMPFPEVREIMMETMESNYGNPSSLHQKGLDAEQYIRKAREIIAKSMKRKRLFLLPVERSLTTRHS